MFDTILLAILLGVLIITAITDVRKGIIPNKVLMAGFAAASIPIVMSYCENGAELKLYIMNALASSFIAIAFFYVKLWGAGDSKLWIFVNLAFPVSKYIKKEYLLFPSMIILMLIFLEAYLYVILESVCLRILKKDHGFKLSNTTFNFEMIINMGFSIIVLSFFYTIVGLAFREYYEPNRIFFALIGVIIAPKIGSVKNTYKKIVCVVVVIIYANALLFTDVQFDFRALLLTIFIVVISNISFNFAQHYNYKRIPTSDVKEGMILSTWTVQMFSMSRIKGLPTFSDESTKCRLSEDEAAAVRRWEKSKTGMESVIIVRYIPFAIFELIGVMTYLIGSEVL